MEKPLPILLTFFLIVVLPSSTFQVFQSDTTIIARAEQASTFSIIWITDTQHLSELYPTYYTSLCNWIVSAQGTFNVKMVVHTGDIVDTEGNQTQWENANKSMSVLLNNSIPYCWDAGNHDYDDDLWIGNRYAAFNPALMQEKPYWVSSSNDGLSTAVQFNVSGWDCLIINIAYLAKSTTLEWAENLINAYPDAHVIVATHAYLNIEGQYNTNWAADLRSMLDTHSNVFLTLSGHYYPTSGVHVKSGDRDELLFNMQEGSAYNLLGGTTARILTFDVQKGTINVQTYVVYANTFLSDADNNFTLTTNFRNNAAIQNNQDESSAPEFPWIAIAVVGLTVAIIVLSLTYVARVRKTKRPHFKSVDRDAKILIF